MNRATRCPCWWVAAAALLLAPRAGADAVVVTRAMTATTIMEAFVDDDAITMELEIGSREESALGSLAQAAFGASNLPIAIPDDAGLSILADGHPLKGEIQEVLRRKRVERDEVSGEPLPKPGGEPVVFMRLSYPLRAQPRQLVFQPPLTDAGYAAADIGFVVYHQGIAVNDFRYLAVNEPLWLDWDDPFYSRFERRALRRQYDSPMNVFLYVEPFEVRKELVIRPIDLARFTELDIEPHASIPATRRDALLESIDRFLRTRAPVTIDGEQPEPILDRIHFLKRGLRMTRVVTADEPVDGTSAIVGAIYVYPVDGLPQEVRLDWDLFDERITRVPAAATDEAGPMPYFLSADQPELQWVNYLKGGVVPNELRVAEPTSHLTVSLVPLVASVLGGLLCLFAIRRRSWSTGAVAAALAVAGWWLPSVGPTLEASVPTAVRPPTADEVRPTLHALLYNVYRALDFRDEEVVFDRLEKSLSGDVLEQVYLEMRKGLRLESQGGARVRVREVEVADVTPEPSPRPGALRYRTAWNATGSVGHWGHTHIRTNAYEALVTLAEHDERWRIAEIEILEEERRTAGPR